MFVEFHTGNPHSGWIEVVCGSMFSGKTEELIRRIRRAEIANQNILLFKPQIDKRYAEEEIVSHDQNSLTSTVVASSGDILPQVEGADVVGIDEAQFFDDGLVEVARKLANSGIRVIIAGLDMDYAGIPFGPVPQLMAIAEFVTKVHAICQRCGSIANFSFRLDSDQSQILVGEKDAYEPRCRNCFYKDFSA